ncbi:hypothetical protein GCM10009792_12710 [Microcella alkalica]
MGGARYRSHPWEDRMELSRKRRRELKKLRGAAENVWNEQREVLDHASKVLRDAGRQATVVARKDVAPRVRDSYERRVQPGIDASVGAVRQATHATKSTVTDDILPAISGALGSAAAAIEVARDKHLREAIRTASRTSSEIATKAGQRLGLIEVKRSPGPGTFVLIGLGVVAAAAIAYAAWQTFRPDDDLWVEDDLDEDLEPATPEETSTAM